MTVAARPEGRPPGVVSPSLLDHVFALRPLLWIPAIALFEAGRATFARGAPPTAAWAAMGSLCGVLGAVHLANGWRDREGDRINRKGGVLATGALPRSRVVALAVGSLAAAVLAARWAALGATGFAILGSAVALGVAYTVPPMEAKRRVGLDLLAQALGYGVVAFALGAVTAAASLAAATRASIPFALGIGTVGLITMLADRAGDEAVGQRTTAVVLGEARAKSLATVLAFLTFATGLSLGAWAPAVWGLLATAWLGLAVLPAWNRVAVALQVLFLVLLAPMSLVPLGSAVGLACVAGVHDRRRGGAGYPFRSGVAAGAAATRTSG